MFTAGAAACQPHQGNPYIILVFKHPHILTIWLFCYGLEQRLMCMQGKIGPSENVPFLLHPFVCASATISKSATIWDIQCALVVNTSSCPVSSLPPGWINSTEDSINHDQMPLLKRHSIPSAKRQIRCRCNQRDEKKQLCLHCINLITGLLTVRPPLHP